MAEQNPGDALVDTSETIELPMGHTYKVVTKTLPDGTTIEEKIPFIPYTKTSAVTDNNNVNLDVILEELRNFTGYPLTTDITCDKPGVYALDASVGAKIYSLCNQVFQSADSSLYDLAAAIGVLCGNNDNFSSIVSEMRNTFNNIRKEIIAKGGKCDANPTLLQIYEAIKDIGGQNGTIVYEPFSGVIAISYNEFAKFPNCGVNKKSGGGYWNNWKHLAFTADFIDSHIIDKADKGLLDVIKKINSVNNRMQLSQVTIKSLYHNYTKMDSYGTEVIYGIEKYYNSTFLENFIDAIGISYSGSDLYSPCIRYKVTKNHDTEEVSKTLYDTLKNTSGVNSYGHIIKFENYDAYVNDTIYKNMSQLMCNFSNDADFQYRMYHTKCDTNPLIGDDSIEFAFSFPTDWHTSCYNAIVAEGKYTGYPMTSEEKIQWKAEPNIEFIISGYTKK